MSRPEPVAGSVHRFSRAVRWVHGVTGLLTVVCILTAAVLYNGSLAELVGNRYVVEQLHVWCGIALPVPLVLGLVDRAYRKDLGLLNRLTSDDRRWLRSPQRRDGHLPVGKFNAGQKVNAALSGGALGALLLTGMVMHFTGLTPLGSRTAATIVHDWFALALGLLVVGHVTYALRDPGAMLGMRTGDVTVQWARREHGAWVGELEAAEQEQVAPPT